MNQPTLFDTASTSVRTFELSQKRKDGTLSNITFIKAGTMSEAKEIASVCWCIGEKVLNEITNLLRA